MIKIPQITFPYITFLRAVGEQNGFKCVISSWNNLTYFPLSLSSCMQIHPHNQKETPRWLYRKGRLHSFLYKCFKSLFCSTCDSSLKQLNMNWHHFWLFEKGNTINFFSCLFVCFFGWIVSLLFIHAWFKKCNIYIVSRKTLLVQFCSLTFNTWKLIYP